MSKKGVNVFVASFIAIATVAGLVFLTPKDSNVVFTAVSEFAENHRVPVSAFEDPIDNGIEESKDTESSSYSLLAMKNAIGKIFCNFTATEEMDLMKLKIPPFIERFKNPCWYEGDTLQCLPYMYIVGADKCGTTDLYKKISFHPDFVPPLRKESQWMPLGRFTKNSSISYYTSTYFSNITAALSTENGSSNLITCDGNVFNLEGTRFWPYLGANVGHDEPVENTADYIHHLNSNAKILINVRNPIEKLWSEYLALTFSRNKSATIFHELVVKGLNLYKDCLQTRSLRSCMYDRNLTALTMMTKEERQARLNDCTIPGRNAVLLMTGVFHVFIRDYLKVFPREQVLIQRVEDFAADGEGSLIRTYKFLDLEMLPPEIIKEILRQEVWNRRRPLMYLKGDMFESTRQILYEFYKPHNEQLAILLNNSKYNYGPRATG